jgi:hypothetical protein
MVYPLVQYVGPAYPEQPQPTGWGRTRELDARTGDGIHVRLLWHPEDDHLSVTVNDTKTGETFELPIHPGEPPLDVFHHPFAYAASRDHRTAKPHTTSTHITISA